ncbi:MAG: hypothetical protein HY735_37100 [Verrucomicrobia bacterium]|nr:hypothetical protein [Verrucomicrobiota bacterium]
MNLLDENIRDDQRALLRKWRIPFRQIGKEISRSGITDENLIPFLHRLHWATLLTQDEDFFNRRLCHKAYGLVFLDVRYKEVAEFIRRFLKHPTFSTQAKRLGIVARVHAEGVQFWRKGARTMQTVNWENE